MIMLLSSCRYFGLKRYNIKEALHSKSIKGLHSVLSSHMGTDRIGTSHDPPINDREGIPGTSRRNIRIRQHCLEHWEMREKERELTNCTRRSRGSLNRRDIPALNDVQNTFFFFAAGGEASHLAVGDDGVSGTWIDYAGEELRLRGSCISTCLVAAAWSRGEEGKGMKLAIRILQK